ncbi:hypothetical protein chiPu_0025838, partial [Chiloscyllium punctatum]|nr:hypothetical protein [Chiloscyllium punctatum]
LNPFSKNLGPVEQITPKSVTLTNNMLARANPFKVRNDRTVLKLFVIMKFYLSCELLIIYMQWF